MFTILPNSITIGDLNNASGILSTRLYGTGQTLISLINSSAGGVSSINNSSGIISLTGAGNITVISGGVGLIQISGETGIYSSFYQNSNPNNYATSGNLTSSGATLYNLLSSYTGYQNTNPSGFITSSQTGAFYPISNPQNYSTSGNLQTTGQAAWNAAQNNAVNLSGNLTATGATLNNKISNISGSIDYKIFKSNKIDFKTTGIVNIYTVPNNYFLSIDTMEVITTNISTADEAPYVKFGNSIDLEAYKRPVKTTSNSQYSKHIFFNPQDIIPEGTILTASIPTGSTALIHSGFLIYKGYLINNE